MGYLDLIKGENVLTNKKATNDDMVKFITRVITSLRYSVDENGLLISSDGTPLLNNGLPFVVPDKNTVAGLTTVNLGVSERKLELFDPLTEDVIKGGSEALSAMLRLIEGNIFVLVYGVANCLLEISTLEKPKDLPLEIQSYLSRLEKNRSRNVKTITSDNVTKTLQKISSKVGREFPKLISIFIKKGAKFDGEVYSRGVTITSPFLDKLREEPDYLLNNLDNKIPKKDATAIKNTFEYILDGYIDDIFVVSNSNSFPGFITILTTYLRVTNHLNDLLDKMVEFVDEANNYKTDLMVNEEELEHLDSLEGALKVVNYNIKSLDRKPSTTANMLKETMNKSRVVGVNKGSPNEEVAIEEKEIEVVTKSPDNFANKFLGVDGPIEYMETERDRIPPPPSRVNRVQRHNTHNHVHPQRQSRPQRSGRPPDPRNRNRRNNGYPPSPPSPPRPGRGW